MGKCFEAWLQESSPAIKKTYCKHLECSPNTNVVRPLNPSVTMIPLDLLTDSIDDSCRRFKERPDHQIIALVPQKWKKKEVKSGLKKHSTISGRVPCVYVSWDATNFCYSLKVWTVPNKRNPAHFVSVISREIQPCYINKYLNSIICWISTPFLEAREASFSKRVRKSIQVCTKTYQTSEVRKYHVVIKLETRSPSLLDPIGQNPVLHCPRYGIERAPSNPWSGTVRLTTPEGIL